MKITFTPEQFHLYLNYDTYREKCFTLLERIFIHQCVVDVYGRVGMRSIPKTLIEKIKYVEERIRQSNYKKFRYIATKKEDL